MSDFRSLQDAEAPPAPGPRGAAPARVFRTGTRAAPSALETWGLASAVGLILAAGGLAGLAIGGARADAESKAFAETSISAIANGWSEQELLSRATPGLSGTPPQAVDTLFAQLRQIGPDARLGGCSGRSRVAFRWLQDTDVTALYDCDLEQTGGRTEVELALRDEPDGWKIAGMRLNSPLFMDEQD